MVYEWRNEEMKEVGDEEIVYILNFKFVIKVLCVVFVFVSWVR